MLSRRHLLTSLLSVCVVAASVAQETARKTATDPAALRASAHAAFELKNYPEAAKYFALSAAVTTGATAAGDYYNAGCCEALAGNIDAAFAMLETGFFRRAHAAVACS